MPFESLAIRIIRHGGIAGMEICGFSEAASDSFQQHGQSTNVSSQCELSCVKNYSKLRNEIIFRIEKMDVLYGSLTK